MENWEILLYLFAIIMGYIWHRIDRKRERKDRYFLDSFPVKIIAILIGILWGFFDRK